MQITNVRINGIQNPIGFTYDQLLCSWCVQETPGRVQKMAVIEVSNSSTFDTILYKKEGKELKQSGEKIELILHPRTTYYYRITVSGDAGDQAVSEVYTFETGKMGEDWRGEWITSAKEDTFHPVFVKKFKVEKKVQRARLYMTGLGLFEAYCNGQKVGQEYLTPYISDYEQEIQVITFQMEAYLREENTLEIMLGKGWYMGVFGLELQSNNYGERMAAIGELHLEYEDGSKECICTDSSFMYFGSDIEASGIYDGEVYNRLLWNESCNNAKAVKVLSPTQHEDGMRNLRKDHLVDRVSQPVLVKEKIEVKEILYTPAGETVLDMGQNFAGYMEFTANLEKGTKVVLDFGEILQEGNFYNKNYRDAKSQFTYISNGNKEIVRPHFTFFGFRYVRVTGWSGTLHITDFIGNVVYSDITRTGYLETANAKMNRLYENTVWGLKSNFLDIPTDCPQRSERLGWTGDAQVFAPTACYHMDTRAFFHKFIKDLRKEQNVLGGGVPNYIPNLGHKKDVGSVWGDIAAFLPNTLFNYYGDLGEMEYCYSLMKDWVDYIDRNDAKRGKRQYLFNFGTTFGDWLALDGPTPTSFKGGTDDSYISSAYYYRSTQIVREMSERLNKTEEAAHYMQLEEQIGQAIFREFFTPSGRLAIDTQTAYVIALKFGLTIDREKVVEQFRSRLQKDCSQIKCGFAGAPLLCTVLAEAGLYELAYDYLLKEGFPSWLYSVNLGATTIWERWNSVLEDGTISDTGMNSLNHYAYGSVMEFVYGYAAGIRALEPGFKKAVIAPHPDIRIPYMNATYHSVNGTYVCNWTIMQDGQLKVHIQIPFHCEAEVELPEYEEGRMTLASGIYDFVYRPKRDFRKPYHRGTTLERVAKDAEAVKILGKYVPVLAGIAASGDAQMGANTLEQLLHMEYLPFDPEQLERAIKEIGEINVMEGGIV